MYARLVVMHLSGFTKGNHAFTYDRNFDVATLAVLLLSVQLETRTRQGGVVCCCCYCFLGGEGRGDRSGLGPVPDLTHHKLKKKKK